MTTRDALRRLITEYELDAYADDILAAAKPAIRIERTRVADDSDIPVGASKLGGSPDVPADFEWPMWNDTPLTFMAQFRLSGAAPYDIEKQLPPSGILYFFYAADEQPWGFEPDHRGSARVYYVENEQTPLERREHPTAEGEFGDIQALDACAVTFSAELTLSEEVQDRLPLPDAARSAYWDLQSELADASVQHHLLGHPQSIQGDMKTECQFAANGVYMGDGSFLQSPRRAELEPGIADWCLLLQLDSDEDDGFGIMWGDVGRIYYWIRRQDLAARDFSPIWLILQCY